MAVLAFLSRPPFSSSSYEGDRPTMSVLDEEIDSDNDNNENEREEEEDFIDADDDDDDWLEICKYYKNAITVAFDDDKTNNNNNNNDGLVLLRRGLRRRHSQRNRILRIHHSLQPDEMFIEWKTKHFTAVVNEEVGSTDNDVDDDRGDDGGGKGGVDHVKCCCPICLIDYQDHDVVTTPLFQKCRCCTRQVFHRDCIAQWLMAEVSGADADGVNDHGTAAAGGGRDRRTGSSSSRRRRGIDDNRYCNSTCPCCRQKIILSDEEFVQAQQQWLKNNMKRRGDNENKIYDE